MQKPALLKPSFHIGTTPIMLKIAKVVLRGICPWDNVGAVYIRLGLNINNYHATPLTSWTMKKRQCLQQIIYVPDRPRDWTYYSHEPECIVATNPDRSSHLITVMTCHFQSHSMNVSILPSKANSVLETRSISRATPLTWRGVP